MVFLALLAAPNPGTDRTNLVVTAEREEIVLVRLTDMLGSEALPAFELTLRAGETAAELPLAGLPAGQYVCSVSGASGRARLILRVVR